MTLTDRGILWLVVRQNETILHPLNIYDFTLSESAAYTSCIYKRIALAFWCLRRRWLQDTSKRKLADFLIVFVPPPLPVSPGSPEVDPTIDQNKHAG